MRLRSATAVALALATVGLAQPAGADVPLPSNVFVRDVIATSDGRTILALDVPSKDRFMVVRLSADGTLDPSFDGDGIVETTFAAGSTARLHDIALDADNRIVAAGHSSADGAPAALALARYLPDGGLDPSLSAEGKVLTTFAGKDVQNPAVALTTTGALVTAASDDDGAGFVMARHRSDGTLDSSFDTDGRAMLDLPGTSERVNDLALDADGNAVVVGSRWAVNQDWVVARVLPDGRFDPDFGTGGVVVQDLGFSYESARAVAIGPDGKIVLTGPADANWNVALARYLPTGERDPGFGQGGTVIVPAGHNPDGVSSVDLELLPDGRIASSGTIGLDGPLGMDVLVVVVGEDGTPDPGFDGHDGTLEVDLGATSQIDSGGLIALRPDGMLAVAGTRSTQLFASGTLAVTAIPIHAPRADLAVSLNATPNPAGPGPVSFTATIRNDGPIAAAGVTLDLGVSQATGAGRTSQGACKPGSIAGSTRCSLGTIEPGAEALVAVGTTVSGHEEGLFATATVASTTLEADEGDNTASVEVVISGDMVM
jgi:uncharacterized delta-60 repeat protein